VLARQEAVQQPLLLLSNQHCIPLDHFLRQPGRKLVHLCQQKQQQQQRTAVFLQHEWQLSG
jgi:ABC-type thiamine transport system ATPase subunit